MIKLNFDCFLLGKKLKNKKEIKEMGKATFFGEDRRMSIVFALMLLGSSIAVAAFHYFNGMEFKSLLVRLMETLIFVGVTTLLYHLMFSRKRKGFLKGWVIDLSSWLQIGLLLSFLVVCFFLLFQKFL
jgi:hypothetical protein